MQLSCQADGSRDVWKGSADVPVTVRSTRSTTGIWTVTGLTPWKPVYVELHSTRTSTADTDQYASLFPVNGFTITGLNNVVGRSFLLGYVSSNWTARPITHTLIPANSTVTLNVTHLNSMLSLQFLQ